MDVIEIDGASNNGVDAIRDLRDNVMFAPSSGKYKIFIIDEVHMLSTSAFNALLKTLEEPPAHVVFILATTEVHKIPQTILSRCQRFDFRRIPLKQTADYLKKICELENIKYENAALWLIVKQGEGSMRDSLSLLDQVISFTNSNLTEADVSQVLGLTERSLVFGVFDCLIQRKSFELVSYLEKLSISGQNPSLFLEDILKLLRHSLLLKADAKATDLIDLPEDEILLLIEKTQNFSDTDLHLLFDMTVKSAQDLTRSNDAQIVFEIALLRMSQAPRISDLKSLLNKSNSISSTTRTEKPIEKPIEKHTEKVIEKLEDPLVRSEQPRPKPFEGATPQAPPAPSVEKTRPRINTDRNIDLSSEDWLSFVEKVKLRDVLFAAKIENLLFVDCRQLKITLQAPQNLAFLTAQLQTPEMRKKLQGFIDSEIAEGYTFDVLKSSSQNQGSSATTIAIKKQELADEKLMEKCQTDPRILRAKEVFNAEIKFVKNTN